MSSVTGERGQDFELEPIELPLRAKVFLKGLRFLEILHERKKKSEAVQEAKRYERKAKKYSNTQPVEMGKLLLSAGKAYMNARRPGAAVDRFETARPMLESFKMGGTLEGFSTLASLYQSLEFAYKKVGREEESAEVHGHAVELAGDMESLFGIRTEFLPGGGQLISSVKYQSLAEQAA